MDDDSGGVYVDGGNDDGTDGGTMVKEKMCEWRFEGGRVTEGRCVLYIRIRN